jgi:membrane protease subunit HflK
MTNPWGDPTPSNSNKPDKKPNRPPHQMDADELEALLRSGQEKLRTMLPQGGSVASFGLLAGVLVLIWLSSGFYRVQEGEIGVVQRFGEVTRTEQPGLRYHLPFPIETALTPNVTFENRIEVGFRSGMSGGANGTDRDVAEESSMLTSDQNIIDLDFAVTWVIKNPQEFLFEIRDPQNTVKRAAESAMREVIGQTEIQSALTEARDAIQRDTKKQLQQILDDYKSGVEVVRVELLRVNPPPSVVDAFNDVQRAEADRERLRNEAEGYKNKIIPEARGEGERIKNESEGYKEQVINNAKGEADRFSKVWQAYNGARDVTAQRLYLETMEEILSNTTTKIIMDSNSSNGVVPYMPIAPKGAQ